MNVSTKETMEHILDAALELCLETDYQKVSRVAIAEYAGVSAGLVSFYFGDMPDARAIFMREAVKREIPEIVARGILDGHPEALTASAKLRKKCQRLFA